MKFTVQTDNVRMFKEALSSTCDVVRFGSEFCEWKIPSIDALKKAYSLAEKKKREFTYVTPLVSNRGLEKIRKHLDYLNDKKVDVTVNDLGVLSLLEKRSNLTPNLGRQLVTVPARSPWSQITEYEVGYLEKRRVSKIFNQSSLNFEPVIWFFKEHGVKNAEVDWIPQCFPHYDFLSKKGLNLSVHLHLIPVTITRRCHMARFLGEKDHEHCSKPCHGEAFLLKQNILDVEMYLDGNVVFRSIQVSKKDLNMIYKSDVAELVITMNQITKVESQNEIDSLIKKLTPKSIFPFSSR